MISSKVLFNDEFSKAFWFLFHSLISLRLSLRDISFPQHDEQQEKNNVNYDQQNNNKIVFYQAEYGLLTDQFNPDWYLIFISKIVVNPNVHLRFINCVIGKKIAIVHHLWSYYVRGKFLIIIFIKGFCRTHLIGFIKQGWYTDAYSLITKTNEVLLGEAYCLK